MKLAIIGTSNSIGPRSYVRALGSSSSVSRLENFSLGHSTSVVLPLSLYRFDPHDFDFCIFDFAVNEEIIIRSDSGRADQIRQRLALILERFHGTSCVPIFLIMPSYLGLDGECLGRRLYKEFAMNRNIPFFDGYRYLEMLQNGSGLSQDDLFRDPDHIAQWPAYALGFILADVLSRLGDQNIKLGSKLTASPEFIYVEAANLFKEAGGEIVHRRNSLVSASFLRVRGVGTYELSLDAPGVLVGLGLDLGNTNARMTIRSENAIAGVDFGVNYYDPTGEKTIFVVRPIFPTVSVKHSFQLSVLQRSSFEIPQLFLHGFSIQMPERLVETLSISMSEIDLFGLLSQHHLRTGILAARSFMSK